MRSTLGFFSVFLIATVFTHAELLPDLPPTLPQPTISAQTSEKDIKSHTFSADYEKEYIPMAEPILDLEVENTSSQTDYIPNAEPLPEETPHSYQPAHSSTDISPFIPTGTFSPIPVPQHKTRVAILGYHDFSKTLPATEMRINTNTFRSQMQALKTAGVPVISMKEFLDWKLGDRQLPEKCVMITIDDGWKSVYTDAYPILKETGFPFTIFPYTKFITGRGSSMSPSQTQEMLNNGATLGSHSVNHLYPKSWRAAQRKGPTAVLNLAMTEINNSRLILQNKFPGSSVDAYCYPGGFVLPEMITKAEEAGFLAAFTVIPKKVTKDTDRWRIHRYIVFGTNPKTFTRALNFNTPPPPENQPVSQNTSKTIQHSFPVPNHPVSPAANTVITHQPSDISISLAGETGFSPKQAEMCVSGFGLVQTKYDDKEKILSWIPSRPLRVSPVTVQVRWKNHTDNTWKTVTWQFGITEQEMHFIPRNVVK